MKITAISFAELPAIIEASTELSRQDTGDILTVKCNHPEHGELIWVQGSGERIVMIQA